MRNNFTERQTLRSKPEKNKIHVDYSIILSQIMCAKKKKTLNYSLLNSLLILNTISAQTCVILGAFRQEELFHNSHCWRKYPSF